MMTKTTSHTKAILYKISLIPVLSALILLLCIETTAQVKPALLAQNSKEKISKNTRDDYYAGVRLIVKNVDGSIYLDKKYEDLSPDEKERFLFHVPKKFAKKSPTAQQIEDYKNAKKYAIWIDDKNVPNSKLNQYKPSQIAYFTGSSVFKNARTKKHPQPFQYSFYTHSYFDKKEMGKDPKKFSGDKIEIILKDSTRISSKIANEKEWKKVEQILQEDIGKTKEVQDDQIYTAVEVKPEFPGGFEEFYKYVAQNFKVPTDFKGNGKIIAQFVIEKDGSLSAIKILRDIGFGSDKEAEKVLAGSPKWKPGLQNGKPVRVLYALPITIQN